MIFSCSNQKSKIHIITGLYGNIGLYSNGLCTSSFILGANSPNSADVPLNNNKINSLSFVPVNPMA